MTPFDPGPVAQPFRSLCEQFPDATVYPSAAFRVEWGPIFHRGRLDGSARVVVIGQDPAQHETVVRRVLVGVAGHRVQGFLAKLGMDRSYAIINAFLYCAYDQKLAAPCVNDPGIAAYRNRWLDALLVGRQVEAVVALGNLADAAWQAWKATPAGVGVTVPYHKIMHPTAPRTGADLKRMLQGWNAGLQALAPGIQHPDTSRPLGLYGTRFEASELVAIPGQDLPSGCPSWMGSEQDWAARTGTTAKEKRATITITVPAGFSP